MTTAQNRPDLDALEARFTDPTADIRSTGQVRTGDAAAAVGRAFLLREYGSQEAIDAEMRPGRPRIGSPAGASPTVRGRITEADHAALEQLRQRTGRSQSDLIREAVHDLLTKHHRAAS